MQVEQGAHVVCCKAKYDEGELCILALNSDPQLYAVLCFPEMIPSPLDPTMHLTTPPPLPELKMSMIS